MNEWLSRLDSLDEGMYYRWRFAQQIRKMVERVISSQTSTPLDRVQRSIQDGEVETDPIRNLQAEQILEYVESFINDSGGNLWT